MERLHGAGSCLRRCDPVASILGEYVRHGTPQRGNAGSAPPSGVEPVALANMSDSLRGVYRADVCFTQQVAVTRG